MIFITGRSAQAGAYVGYEYSEQMVSDMMAPLYADNYPYFGWELEGRARPLAGVGKVIMRFRRNRRLANKVELTRLQRQFDAHVKDIVTMEQSKILAASMVAYVVGIVGCAFLAGAVFAYLGGLLPLCIIFAVPGVAGWVVPYWCYLAISKRKSDEVQPFIQQKYEDIDAVCERAYSLLG